MNVGELRHLLDGVSDETPVVLEIDDQAKYVYARAFNGEQPAWSGRLRPGVRPLLPQFLKGMDYNPIHPPPALYLTGRRLV